jgi:hypothetical protein
MIKLKQIEFKAHICIFRQILEEILVNLSPYFEVDYLLPRTLMACLTLEQLPIVVRSGFIPPDITIRTTVNFINCIYHLLITIFGYLRFLSYMKAQ